VGVCPRDLSVIATAALARWQLAQMAPLGPAHLLAGADAWMRPLRSRPAAVAGMSALQLGLLVAAQRLEDQGHGTFNFEVRPRGPGPGRGTHARWLPASRARSRPAPRGTAEALNAAHTLTPPHSLPIPPPRPSPPKDGV
jgi:hypothetical protein